MFRPMLRPVNAMFHPVNAMFRPVNAMFRPVNAMFGPKKPLFFKRLTHPKHIKHIKLLNTQSSASQNTYAYGMLKHIVCQLWCVYMKIKPVLGFANQKGGVGKTTWAKTFSEYMAIIKNVKLLGLDIDSQTSYTARFLEVTKNPVTDYKEPPKHPLHEEMKNGFKHNNSTADIFSGWNPLPYPTKLSNLDIIPADEGGLFFETENIKKKDDAEKIYNQLNRFLTLNDIQSKYDFFVIDTPPAKGFLTISAFKAMTHLVIPLEIELQSIEGLAGLLQLWKQESMSRPKSFPLELVGILPNKVHSRRASDRDLLNALRSDLGYSEYVLPVQMGDRTEMPVCDLENKSVFQYTNSNLAKKEAITVCDCIYSRIYNE
jgi:chromosome partitioning protein